MKYSKNIKEDKQKLKDANNVVRKHLANYMERKDWNQKGLSLQLHIAGSEVCKIFYRDNNFTLKRLIDISIKTGSKLVISFEQNKK